MFLYYQSGGQVFENQWNDTMKQIFRVVILQFILALQIQASTTGRIYPDNPLIRYTGRFDFSTPRRARFDWPGVSIEAAFEGGNCTAVLKGYGETFNVFVDGEFLKVLKTDTVNEIYDIVCGLEDSVHTVLITKRYLIENVICEFEGFIIDEGKNLREIPSERPQYRIEFVGASSLNGFGNEASSVKCESVLDSSNSYYSYGPLTARTLNSECVVVAATGKGVVRNWGTPFISSFDPFNPIFFRTLLNSRYPQWNHAKWVPHVVVVCLGTNDFSSRPYPDKNVFIYNYTAFIQHLMDIYPGVKIVCLTSDKQPVCSYVKKIVDKFQSDGVTDVHSVVYAPVAYHNRGCDWHPNIAAHEKISQKLVKTIEPLLKEINVSIDSVKLAGSQAE